MPASSPRCVVIGYGYAGRAFHSYLVSITPGLTLRGICSRNPETRAKIVRDRGCRAYETFEAVLADPEVDLVILATPNGAHAAQAIAALQAGKHVVTDKVMAPTLAEADAMIAAAHKSGKMLSVFQNRRWDGDYLTLRKLIADGTLGELRSLELAWHGFGMWGGWRSRAEDAGGKLLDVGAHLVDQALQFFPQTIQSVYARMHHDFPQFTAESQAHVIITFAGGLTAIVDTSSLSALAKPRFHAFGTKGTYIKYGRDPQEDAMNKGQIDTAVEDPQTYGRFHDGKTETIIPTLAGRWRSYYENVRDTLTGKAPAVKLTEVRRAIAVLDAAFHSARTGQAIELNLPPAA
jgi:scyllo-inositol 2-dehydrogenase (NADP+)